jgi:aspartyl-tRNA(Asn)/glutamyl-tRNA(Gln) amidotransferase subunit B
VTAERDEGGHAREWRPMQIRITRLHLEEDAGKNVHEGLPETNRYSYIDLNRAGTPLAEIVTEPDFRTSWEAYDYVNHVRRALQWVGASEADMEKGNLRCEANVSVREVGAEKFGTKVELKNLNSVRFMQRAIEFEIERQIALIESGGKVSQETRLWDERANETRVMRSKEEAHDYRYFPEPDLQPLTVASEWVEQVRSSMPELPDARRKRFMEQYELSFNDASLLVRDRALADFYERAAAASNPRGAANWLKGELLRELDAAVSRPTPRPSRPKSWARSSARSRRGASAASRARTCSRRCSRRGRAHRRSSKRRGSRSVSDAGEIEKMVADVLASNPQQLEAYRGGKEALFGFFVGQVLKASKGKANPKVVNELLKEKLKAE